MTNLCGTVCLVPADHSAEALGDLVAPCSLPTGHQGQHSNDLAVWENVGDAQREQYRDAMTHLAKAGSVTALRVLVDALVPADDMSEAAQDKRIQVWACLDEAVDFACLGDLVWMATRETAA